MQRILRRISSSFLPRPDRPWSEDATSTAPQIYIGRKRRFSITEPDEESLPSTPKKPRAESEESQGALTSPGPSQSPTQEVGVKEVTKGVQEVGIGDGDKTSDTTSDAAAVPLPDSPGLEPRSEIAGSTEPQEAPLSDELVLTTEEPKQEVTVISEEAVDVGPEEATQVVGRTEESDKERNEKGGSLTKLGEEPPDNAAVVLDIDDSVRSQDTHELREETEDAAQKKDEEA